MANFPLVGISEDFVRACIRNDQGFMANSGILATATNGNLTVGGICVFNNSTTKNIYIFSLLLSTTHAGLCDIYHVTADEVFGAPITPANMNLGSAVTSLATCDSSATGIAVSVTKHGTKLLTANQAQLQGPPEQLTNGSGILLPAGSAHGIAVYPFLTTAADQWACVAKYVEF